MTKEKEDYLFTTFPNLFPNGKNVSNQVSLMCYGFPDDGWFALIKKICERITATSTKVTVVQVKEKFGCYDKKTEILTNNGWKFFKDLKSTDMVASLSNQDELKFVIPSDMIQYKYKGLMYFLNTKQVNLCVTPNHNLYCAKGSYYNGKIKGNVIKRDYPFELCVPEKYFKKNKRFKKTSTWSGKSIECYRIEGHTRTDNYTDSINRKVKRTYEYNHQIYNIIPFLQLLGWYIAEGHYHKNNISLCLNYKNTKEILRVESILDKLELKHKLCKGGIIRIYNTILGTWLKENCGHLAPNKKVPEFIKHLTSELINYFLTELYLGDGHKAKTANMLYSTSKTLINNVQELIIKCGNSSTIYKEIPPSTHKGKDIIINGKHTSYAINWMTKTNFHNTMNKKKYQENSSQSYREEWIDYDDMVYCVSVPENILLVRREGKHYFCGNSLRYYVDFAAGTSKEDIDIVYNIINEGEAKSEVTCEQCGKPGILRAGGWIRTLCDEHSEGRQVYKLLDI